MIAHGTSENVGLRLFIGGVPDLGRADGPNGGAEGFCVRVSTGTASSVVDSVASVNAYRIGSEAPYWLIRDFKIIGGDDANRGALYEPTLLFAFQACMCLDVPLERIIWVRDATMGLSILKFHALGLRPLTGCELLGLMPSILHHDPTVLRKPFAFYTVDEQRLSALDSVRGFLESAIIVERKKRFFEIQRPACRTVSLVRKLLRALKRRTAIELEVVTLDETWPQGELERMLRKWTGTADGICTRVTVREGGEELKLGRGRAYHVVGVSNGLPDDWMVLGDVFLVGLVRRNRLHEKLIAARVIACIRNFQPHRIVWAPGRYQHKADKLGFRQMERRELCGAPRAILKLAAKSRRANPQLRSGLYCVDERSIPMHLELVMQMTTSGELVWRGTGSIVAHRCGNHWQQMVSQVLEDWHLLGKAAKRNGRVPSG